MTGWSAPHKKPPEAIERFDRLEHAGVEDQGVGNDDRPVAQAAADVLRQPGLAPVLRTAADSNGDSNNSSHRLLAATRDSA